MPQNLLERYIQSIQSNQQTTPALIDSNSILSVIERITGKHIESYEEITTEGNHQIYIYDILEDKKELSIEVIRKFLIDIELKPYSGKNIFIIRHFDTATNSAQNAMLKVLEECPIHAVILLETEDKENIIETILSRTLKFIEDHRLHSYSENQEIIHAYQTGDYKKIIQFLHTQKPNKEEAIAILKGVYPYVPLEKIDDYEEVLMALKSTHENPKSLLDLFFL